ncbi:UNVERIFIED_CONTAM: hypothetical protein RMT77_011787 [Armadillidium vulgare]
MDQGNIGDVSPLYMSYDVTKNYLYDVQVRSLEEYSMMVSVIHSFECDEAVGEIRRLLLVQGEEDTNNLFMIVKNHLPINSLIRVILKEVNVTIQLIYDEMKRFLGTILGSDKSIFIGNFVFNWQGVINPRETVLRVIKSTTLSVKEKFEISCRYLFDEHEISTLFNNLTQEDKDYYFNFGNFTVLHDFFIFNWVMTLNVQYLEEFNERLLGMHDLVFINYVIFHFNSEMAVKHLFDNIPLADHNDKYEILDRIILEPENHIINIVMYMLFTLNEDALFHRYAYEILTRLVKNSRWHDTFIRYFRLLRNHVENDMYLSLIYDVLMGMRHLLKIEDGVGKYTTIWREFVQLIPIRETNFMRNTFGQEYAKKVFELLTYQDINLINLFLSIDIEENQNVTNKFYELTTIYFDSFAEAFRQNSNNIGMFLRMVIKSEDQVTQLLTRLQFTEEEVLRIMSSN